MPLPFQYTEGNGSERQEEKEGKERKGGKAGDCAYHQPQQV
jgi:hypothetical protein